MSEAPKHFIQQIVDEDKRTGKWDGRVHTRFPPEPNGYLHIGHAKSICLNYGLARDNGGLFNVRFDDTNPAKEEQEYVDSIVADVKWLGAEWGDRLFFASSYFEQMYQWAEELVSKGKAYVCDLTADQVREYRGTLTQPGRDSPYRGRSPEENLALLRRMKAGEFPDGSHSLRAKIDMASGNLNLRDPVMSKRKLLELVQGGHVHGWDDPRMPTLSGYRRRGYTPESIWRFCEEIGVTKTHSVIDVGRLENAIRDDLNRRAPRRMAVLRPLKVVVENYPEGQVEELEIINNPEDPSAGTRKVPFSRELYLEREDFMEDPPKKFFRLAPGREVRLRSAYFVKCTGVIKDPTTGEISELRCTYDPATRGGESPPDGRKVKATLHWLSAGHAVPAEVRLFDRLFVAENPDGVEGKDYKELLNPRSLEVLAKAFVEPSLASALGGERYQFERLGYFCVDPDSDSRRRVFNRTVTLRDAWAKELQKQGDKP
jgi:glutamyl/glutaminyl-tRNA synthetase